MKTEDLKKMAVKELKEVINYTDSYIIQAAAITELLNREGW